MEKELKLKWGVNIPMRDCVELNATVYLPGDVVAAPTIFTLTPYVADTLHERAVYFAGQGYVYVAVDCRGRGNSGGRFEANINEDLDGHDIVQWLSHQAWCDGSVTMWGGSYAGFNQWMTLKEFPQALKTIVPAAATKPGIDFPVEGNVFHCEALQWESLVRGKTPNNFIYDDISFWKNKYFELYKNHLPFCQLDSVAGLPSASFQKALSHYKLDAFHDAMDLTPEQYRRIDIPILSITGYYDDDQLGAMHFYQKHMRYGSQSGREQHYLLIGPWDHSGTRTPKSNVGGVEMGEACLLDMNKLHTQWYDWVLRNGPRPGLFKKRICYFLTAANEWKYADSLDTISNETRCLYLNSFHGQANDVMRSGSLDESGVLQSVPDTYTYNPLDTRPGELEMNSESFVNYEGWVTEQGIAYCCSNTALIYHSAAFSKNTEITGHVKLVAWIEMNVPDTDFLITLSEILETGESIRLSQSTLRARYRESLREEILIEPGVVNKFEFGGFPFFSRLLAKGSRLRLIIRAPNSIYLEKNYNSGGLVSAESAKDAKTATIKLYHDSKYQSQLQLPIVN